MPTVWIPALMRDATGGSTTVEVEGGTVREVLEALAARYPGVKERVMESDRLRPGLRVAVDGVVARLGLLQPVQPASEIHFLPAVAGGAPPADPLSHKGERGRTLNLPSPVPGSGAGGEGERQP